MKHHNHEHKHENNHNELEEISFNEKLKSLLKHWINHNLSHRENYISWSQKAEQEGLTEVVSCFKQVEELTDKANLIFEKALKELG